MEADYRSPIDFKKLAALTSDERVDPMHIRDARYDDARVAFERMSVGDFQLSQRQIENVRALETGGNGSCPACGQFPAEGRHARSEERGRIVWECDLKRAIDLLPSLYRVTLQSAIGSMTVDVTTWKIGAAKRGIAYRLMITNMPSKPTPNTFKNDIGTQLLATDRASSSWDTRSGPSEAEYLKRELTTALRATVATVKALI